MKFTTLFGTAAAILWLGTNTFAASSMTGVISDSMCGKSHAAMKEHDKSLSDKKCTTACIEHGAKYVFVEGENVLQIDNQNFKALPKFAGTRVTLTGDVKGDTVTVTKIAAAKK